MGEIWVLDDDRGILESIKCILEEDYHIKTFSSPAPLFRELKTRVPQLFLFDVLLTGTTGVKVAKQIKRNPRFLSVPVILMSAQNHLVEHCRECGAIDSIEKPFNVEELVEKIDTYLPSKTMEPGAGIGPAL